VSKESSDNQHHERVKAVFLEAQDLAPHDRAEFIQTACGDDREVLRRVRALFAALDEESASPGFMQRPTVGPPHHDATSVHAPPDDPTTMPSDPAAPFAERPGTVIAGYKLLQQIGEGGFGSGFMAEQSRPVQRKVSLKIIKLGMDTKHVVARFEQERQALTLMDHANIAKVLDAGATSTGRPYFVMELCKGDPITTYCDANNLTIGERLTLFEQVCNAVQHAHHKGVIHRDIKPSNVLVSTQDGRPFAKVIDFGIAKAINSRLTEKTLFTEHRQFIGTPEYMSPEQSEGSLDVDTRSDVYSLGVLLYELLTGATPFDSARLRSAAYAEIQRIIREVEPPAPSTRLSQSRGLLAAAAAHRRSEPSKLGTIIRGELDWIVMKALDKDLARRSETPNDLAVDVQRYLDGEAVRAAPPSTAYRLRTFVRRHRGPVIASMLLGATLLLGIIGTSIGLVRAERERNAAQASQREAETITTFLSEMLAAVSPEERGRTVSMRAVLDEASGRITTRLEGLPSAEARLRRTIAQAYRGLGELESANDHLEAALYIRRRELGERHPDTVTALADLAGFRQEQGRYDEAERLAKEALAAWTGDEAHLIPLGIRNNLAQTYVRQGLLPEAIVQQRATVEGMRRTLGATAEETLGSTVNLATMLLERGDAESLAESERLLVRVTSDWKDAHGADDPGALFAGSQLVVLGDDHPVTARTQSSLGVVLDRLGRTDEARTLYESAWKTLHAKLGESHHDTVSAAVNLLDCYEGLGWPESARTMLPRLIAGIKVVAHQPRACAGTLNTCAWFLLTAEPESLRDPQTALVAIERGVAQARAAGNGSLWSYLDTLALAYARTGSFAPAIAAQREALSLLPKSDEAFRGEMEGRLREYGG